MCSVYASINTRVCNYLNWFGGVRVIFTSCAPSRKYTLHTVCATYATEECTLYALSLCIGVAEYAPHMPQVFHKGVYTTIWV